jgi:hypothetical protein
MDQPKNVADRKDVPEPPKPSKKAYEKPCILEHVPLEVQAGLCDPPCGKADLIQCSTAVS